MSMSIMEAIRSRRSVRTFDGTPLSAEDAQKILDFAAEKFAEGADTSGVLNLLRGMTG